MGSTTKSQLMQYLSHLRVSPTFADTLEEFIAAKVAEGLKRAMPAAGLVIDLAEPVLAQAAEMATNAALAEPGQPAAPPATDPAVLSALTQMADAIGTLAGKLGVGA